MAQDPSYTDLEIVQALQAGGGERERMVTYLINQHAGYIYSFQKKYHFSLEDCRDLYADSIVALSHQIERGDFRSESKLSTYLFVIMNNKCKRHLEKTKENLMDYFEEIPRISVKARDLLQELVHKDEMNWLDGLMKQLGEVCRKILLDSEYYGYRLGEVAERINYKSQTSVSSKKYSCLKELRRLIQKYRSSEKI